MAKRKVYSIKKELIKKSREAAMSAVQIYNNPNILFKSESFVVLMNIAWTYLMHAFYRENKIDYRYYKMKNVRKKFSKTKNGAFIHWDLSKCINNENCPVDKDTKNNLMFIIGLRNEIEHKMTSKIDELLAPKFQACCINYNDYVKELFCDKYGIDKHLSFTIQFSAISIEQKQMTKKESHLPKNIISFIDNFEKELTSEEYNNPKYAYRVIFTPKIVNHKGQADQIIEFIGSDSPLCKEINNKTIVIREKEKKKYFPKQIVDIMKGKGFEKFSIFNHTRLWKEKDAKDPKKGYGTNVGGKQWLWYENWVEEVEDYCEKNRELYE